MFETAELGHTVSKEDYEREVPGLRGELLDLQYTLLESKGFSVLILLNGLDGAGKGETVNLLHEWLDPRHLLARGFDYDRIDPAEAERPWLWRYWQCLPQKGKTGILVGSWYGELLQGAFTRTLKRSAIEHRLEQIKNFERLLEADGVLLIKLFFHLSLEQQKARLKALRKDPDTRWRVTDADLTRLRHYAEYRRGVEKVLRETSTGPAPWTLVEGFDERYRALTVGTLLRDRLKERLEGAAPPQPPKPPPVSPGVATVNILDRVDLTKVVPKKRYEQELEHLQGRLNELSRHKRFQKRSALCVFEGWDAAGKGSTIRRLTQALDARRYEVVPIAAPSEEERGYPYLWRFWRRLPRHGRFTFYDRSWYGRVLVERVEGFADEITWQRAYAEINDFEEQLVERGVILCKFWLHIDEAEQERRFRAREETGYKRFKITEEDWRNREKAPAYREAVADMVERTSTDLSPWTLVEANDKRHARLKVLRTLVDAVEAAL